MAKAKVLALGACLLFALNGCIAVPFISGFREMGVTAGSREELLRKDIAAFHRILQSKDSHLALHYVDTEKPELVESLRNELRRVKESERLVDSEIDFVQLSDNAFSADVEVRVKYFKIPYYIVRSRLVKEKWSFSAASGWRIVARTSEDLS